MPIKISKDLPARKILNEENVFIMDEKRAVSQDIRPLKIAILNLMPKKIETETQLGIRKIDAFRTLTTESLAVFIPFRVQEISDERLGKRRAAEIGPRRLFTGR